MVRPSSARTVMWALAVWCCLGLFFSTTCTSAFYIPGATETSYKTNESVPFWVNSLRSSSVMFPIDYTSMPFCLPKKVEKKSETIGEIIWGDRQYNSPYTATMGKNVTCTPLSDCSPVESTKLIRNYIKLEKMINNFYRVFINVDNLPAFTNTTDDSRMKACASKLGKNDYFLRQRGYPLGIPRVCSTAGALLNNHLDFKIYYNYASNSDEKDSTPTYIVVGLEVEAYSIAWKSEEECTAATSTTAFTQHQPLFVSKVLNGTQTLNWTYGYSWVKSNLRWATRWDWYLVSAAASSRSNHILSLCLSTMVVIFISFSVACILLRALHKDFNRYNAEDPEDLQEETGWKLIHADVFRPPFEAHWLSILVANGCQVLCTAVIVLVVALLGFLSPSRRGALATAMLFTAISTSVIGGFVCGTLLQYLNCRSWKHIFMCSLTLPGGLLIFYLVISIINKANGATTAVPFTTLLEIVVLVVGVSLPLTVLGGSFAFRFPPISSPTRVGRLAREIPEQSLLNRPVFMYLFFPLMPLIVAVIEMHFVMQDLWEGQIYYSFGFLAATVLIWSLTCALTTISSLYYVLCHENHRWWWVAYMVPSGGGLHMFAMALFFFLTQLNVASFSSALLFFFYMGVVAYLYGLAAGAIGVITSILFVRKIYGSIKID